jgi:glycosyltransferase involved in cell wall biosynthesis
MRVCHIITRLVVGGAQENTIATCIGLRKLGYDVDLVTGPQTGPEGTLAGQARAAGVPLLVVDALRRAPNPLHDVAGCAALARLLRRGRYDIVHTHSGKAGFLGRLAAKLAGVPVIVHTIHGPSFYRYQNLAGNWLFTWAEQVAGEWTTQFVSVADAMTEQYLAAGIGTPSRYVTIHSGMDTTAFERAAPAEIPGIMPGDRVVGKIARLFRLKGHEFLFEAAPRICDAAPDVKFLLVGDGVYRERFEREADRLGLSDRFIFAGLVPPGEVPRYVARMDVLVHLSLREGLPRALPQALAAGKPVVAFDVDGAREVCRDGQTGILLRPGDAGGLAEAVIRLLQDSALARRMGAQGRELVRERFTEARMVKQIDELYRRLVTIRS